jgi:TP901 family phage tail tape measure protein
MATNTEKVVVQVIVKGGGQLDALTKKTTKATKSAGGLTKGMAKMAAGMFAATVVFRKINQVVGTAITTFKDFEFQMAKVKAISGASNKDFKVLSKTAQDLGRSTFFTATQVAELQTNYAKLGFTTQEILNAQEATLLLATATGSDLGRAAVVAGAAVRGFNLDASETTRVVDVMTLAFNSSALDIEKWQTSMTKVAPIAAGMNIPLEETAAIMGTLTDAGIEASIAGTSMRNIFLKMKDSSSDLSKFLGFTVNSSVDLAVAIEKLGTASDTTLDSLVNIRQVAAFSVMVRGAARVAKLTEELRNAKGAADEAASIIGDTLEGAFKRLASATQGLSIELVGGLGGGLKDIVDGLANFVNRMTDSSEKIQEVIRWTVKAVKWIGLFTAGWYLAAAGIAIATTATKIFNRTLVLTRSAITKTGVGALVVGLGYLADKFIFSGEAAEDAAEGLDTYADSLKKISERQKDIREFNNKALATTIKQGKIDEKIQKKAIENWENAIEANKALRDDLAEGSKDRKDFDDLIVKQLEQQETMEKKLLRIQLNNAEIRTNKIKLAFDNELKAEEDRNAKLVLAEKNKLLNSEIDKEQLNKNLENLEIKHLEKLKGINSKYNEDTNEIENEILDLKIKAHTSAAESLTESLIYNMDYLTQSTLDDLEKLKEADKIAADERIANGQRVLEALKTSSDAIFSIMGDNAQRQAGKDEKILEERKDAGLLTEQEYEQGVERIQRKAFERKKRMDIAQVMIDTALAIAKIKLNAAVAASNPVTILFAGMSLSQIGLAYATGAAQIAVIAAQQFGNGGMIEEFANGGMVNGKSHAQGGEKFAVGGRVVELEGGEAVINKRSTSMFSSQLSAMNAAGGGVKFADGGLLNQPSFSQQQFNALGQNQMMGAMGGSGKVVVVEADITNSQNTVSVIQSQATI